MIRNLAQNMNAIKQSRDSPKKQDDDDSPLFNDSELDLDESWNKL